MISDGKRFELNFRDSCIKLGVYQFRIRDTYVNAKNADPNAYIPQQACDYILHYGKYLYLMELKTTDKKYITIEREAGQHGMIHYSQWTQMRDSMGTFERAGLVLQYDRGTDTQMTYYMPLEGFLGFLETSPKKSINRLDVVQHGGIPISQRKMRTNWDYDIKDLLDKIN